MLPSSDPSSRASSAFTRARASAPKSNDPSPSQHPPIAPDNSWLFPPPPRNLSSMIGPTSTFYDPADASQRQRDSHALRYQHWIDAHGFQQQQMPYSQQTFGQSQNQYNFVQGQYTPPTTLSQYAGSASGTATQSNLGIHGLGDGDSDIASIQVLDESSYQSQRQQQNNALFAAYYPELSTSAPSNQTSQSYQQQHYQQRQHRQVYSSHDIPDPSSSYTSSLLAASNALPHHSSASLSPASQSWTDDGLFSTTVSSVNSTSAHNSGPGEFSSYSNSRPGSRSHPNTGAANSRFPSPQQPQPQLQTSPSPASISNPPVFNSNQTESSAGRPQPRKRPQPNTDGPKNSSISPQPSPSSAQESVADASNRRTGGLEGGSGKSSAQGKRKRAKKSPETTYPAPAVSFTGSAGAFATFSGGSGTRNTSLGSGGDMGGDDESDSDSDDDDVYDGRGESGMDMGGGISVGMGGLGVKSRRRGAKSRLPGACTHCKKLKMRCEFPKHDNTCKRCKSGGHVCIVVGRKPRTAPNKREYLLAQIRQKDAIIESLLKQLHNPYIATPLSIASYRMATSPSDHSNRNILAWLDRLQASVRTAGGKGGPSAFKLDDRGAQSGAPGVEDESDSEGDRTQNRANMGGEDDDDDTTQDTEKLQSSLPDSNVPLGLIANLSLSNSKAKNARKKDYGKDISEDNLDDDDVGVANDTYFMPGPATDLDIRATLIEQHSPPEILVHGLVTPEDVDKLFEIFFNYVNPFLSLLDPVLHTPASTFARCPFLFTVICAISSRYHTEKSEIYPIAMHFAKHSAANALIDGWKSVELCQAYILMSVYAVPARRWEEDRSWLYTGLAIRIATDLNLHQVVSTKPQNEKEEREILNRVRVWLICFNLDRSTATQFGKPSTIKEDYIVRRSKDWYKKSQYNHPYDLHLSAYSALLQIVAKFHDEIFSDPSSPSGLNKQVDFRTVTMTHDAHLTQYHEEWSKRFVEDSDPNDRGSAFRCRLLPFLVGYSRLVMFSFGFQQAFQRGIEPGDQVFFSKCLDAAKSVIRNMIEGLAPTGYMRYAPDGHFVFASFASAFLLKLLRPEFSNLLAKDQENDIFDLIGRLIQTLSSPDIAIDDRHTPKLYARFLAGLISRHRRDGATVGRLHTQPPPHSQIPRPSPTNFSQPPSQPSNSYNAAAGHGGSSQGRDQGYMQNVFGGLVDKMDTPIYRPEATFSSAVGPIHFGTDFDMSSFGNSGVADEEMLATMHALKNPAWWQNMMMPGFSWPEPSPPQSSPSPPYHHQNMSGPGLNTGFGMFHVTQVPLH